MDVACLDGCLHCSAKFAFQSRRQKPQPLHSCFVQRPLLWSVHQLVDHQVGSGCVLARRHSRARVSWRDSWRDSLARVSWRDSLARVSWRDSLARMRASRARVSWRDSLGAQAGAFGCLLSLISLIPHYNL